MKTVTKNAEAKLLEVVDGMRESSDGYYSLHFHLSQLQEQYRSPYQIKIAVNIVNDLFKGQKGVIFVAKDSDIIILYNGTDRGLLEKAIFQLRYLFMDDPLGYSEDGFENEDFCSVCDLEFQWRDFYNTCKQKVGRGMAVEEHAPTSKIETPTGRREKFHLLTPEYLVDVLSELEDMDIHNTFRSQPVCAALKDKSPRPIFKETYVNIRHLQQLLSVDVDLLSSKTLFKHLTKTLDKRILVYLKENNVDPKKNSFSLNLNAKTLFSEEFAAFDAKLNPNQKASVVIEIAISDVFEDTHQFIIARDTVQNLGYRICLDGIDDITFPQIDRKELGFDLAKLQWDPEMRKVNTTRSKRLADAVKECGPNRIILCRCDDQDAIDFGHSLGISLFQGRHLDNILDPHASVVN